jgi:hypothetical protein
MGRLLAIVLGGAALALYLPALLPDQLSAVSDLWKQLLTETWHQRVLASGAGILAGVALVLLAVRGKE